MSLLLPNCLPFSMTLSNTMPQAQSTEDLLSFLAFPDPIGHSRDSLPSLQDATSPAPLDDLPDWMGGLESPCPSSTDANQDALVLALESAQTLSNEFIRRRQKNTEAARRSRRVNGRDASDS